MNGIRQTANNTSHILLRFLGLSGVLGGLILLFGDQLLYWGPIENLSNITTIATGQVPIETLGTMPEWRHLLTGIAPLLTVWGYSLGGVLVFFALKPAGNTLAVGTSALFISSGMAVAIIHTLYFGIGISAKSAYLVGTGFEDATIAVQIAVDAFNVACIINYVPGTLGSLLFGYVVLTKATNIPKWVLVVHPMILVNSQYIVLPALPENMLKVIIMGGYVNMSFTIFFAVLTYLMWNGGKNNEERHSQTWSLKQMMRF